MHRRTSRTFAHLHHAAEEDAHARTPIYEEQSGSSWISIHPAFTSTGDVLEHLGCTLKIPISAAETSVTQIGAHCQYVGIHLITALSACFKSTRSHGVAKMPNSAFSPECRVP